LLGYSYINNSNGISRVLPDEHPELDLFYAYKASADGKGVLGDTDSDSISWTVAYVNTDYAPVPYNVLEDSAINSEEDRYVERQMTISANFLTLQGTMKFVTDSSHSVIQNPPNKFTCALNLQYTWHWVPADMSGTNTAFIPPIIGQVNACLGQVNSLVFDPDCLNAPVGTVLFLGMEPKLITPKLSSIETSGQYYWEIVYHFLYMNNGTAADGNTAGHNYIYHVTSGVWDLVTTDGTSGGNTIYQKTDLNQLFVLDDDLGI
jgi:hypothetical protein